MRLPVIVRRGERAAKTLHRVYRTDRFTHARARANSQGSTSAAPHTPNSCDGLRLGVLSVREIPAATVGQLRLQSLHHEARKGRRDERGIVCFRKVAKLARGPNREYPEPREAVPTVGGRN